MSKEDNNRDWKKDLLDAGIYAFRENMMPAIQQGAYNLVTAFFKKIIFQDKAMPGDKHITDKVSYHSYYGNGRTTYNNYSANTGVSQSYRAFDFDKEPFDSSAQALGVVEALKRDIAKYGHATVQAFYEYAERRVPGNNYQISNYGWKSLDATTSFVRYSLGKYYLDLPPVEPVK